MAQSSDGWHGMQPGMQPGFDYQQPASNDHIEHPNYTAYPDNNPTFDYGQLPPGNGYHPADYYVGDFNGGTPDSTHLPAHGSSSLELFNPQQANTFSGYGQQVSNDANQETRRGHGANNLMYQEPAQQVHMPFQRNFDMYSQSSQAPGFRTTPTPVPRVQGSPFVPDRTNSTTPIYPSHSLTPSNDHQPPFNQHTPSPAQSYHGAHYEGNGHHVPYPTVSGVTAGLNGSGSRNFLHPQQGISSTQVSYQQVPQVSYQQPHQQPPHHQSQFPISPYQMTGPQRPDLQQVADRQLPGRQAPGQPIPTQQPYQQLQYQQTTLPQAPSRQISNQKIQEAALAPNQQLQGAAPVQLPSAPTGASQETPIVGPSDNPIWVHPDGCPFVEVLNPPSTRIGTAAELELESNNILPQYTKALLPKRGARLPCEIQAELNNWHRLLKDNSASSSEKERYRAEIEKLNNEPVILSYPPGSKPIAKARASTKRKPSSMDPSSKKPGTSSDGTREESLTDSTARKIKEKKRPIDSVAAVEYDIVKILWRDPKHPEPSQKAIQESVTAFGNYVTDLWSKSKKSKADMEEAITKNDRTKSELLRADMESKYRSIRTAIESALNFGDKFTLSQLGIHMKLLGGLFVMLRNFFQNGDYNGPLPKAIMRLASLFVTVDTEFLKDKVKFDKVYLKYKSDLDAEARGYLDQIFDNAKNRSSLKAQEARGDAKNEEVKKPQLGALKKPSTTSARDSPSASKAVPPKKEAPTKKPPAEIKRMQPTDYSGLGSARKVSKRPGDEDVDSRAPKKTAIENTTGAPAAAKPQSSAASTTAPPASSANTQSRTRPTSSMLPGRSRVPAKAQPKKAAPPVSTSSTIGNILDQISKPKEKPKQIEEPTRAPETPEETARRLRKESRRHLRVVWKPDHLLTEVKIFEHDTAEDKGRDQNMLRDARDNRSEGQMLKQRVRDDVDDDDDGAPEEVALRDGEWNLFPTSLKRIHPEVRERTYVTRGGLRPVQSEQKKVMEEHESRELMAIYTSLSEIPESPRSPSHRINGEVKQPRIHVVPSTPSKWEESLPPNTPKRVEVHRRWTEHRQLGPALASHFALERCCPADPNVPAKPNPALLAVVASHPRTPQGIAAETLALLKSDRVKGYVDPDPYDPNHPKTQRRHDYADPKVQRDVDALEDIFAQFKGKPYPATEPPAHISTNPERVAEWHEGRNRDIIAKVTQQQLQPQPQPQLQPQPQTQTPVDISQILQQVRALTQPAAPVAPVTPSPAQSLQAVLATLAITQTSATPQAAPAPAPAQQSDLAQAWAASWAQNLAAQYGGSYGSQPESAQSYGAQPQAQVLSGYGAQPQAAQAYGGQAQPGSTYGDYSQYSQSQDAQNQRDYNDYGERNNRKDFHRGAPTKDHKAINRSLIGTKPCTFWAKGQCAKGDKCTFRHDPNDLK